MSRKTSIVVFAVGCMFTGNIFATEEPYGSVLGDYNGVTIYSNSGRLEDGIYQCVEFVKRYYQEFFGIALPAVGDAKNYATNAKKLGLAYYPGGQSTVQPQAGDVLVSDGGTHGHVAVIRSVSDSQVCVAQQNFYNSKDGNNNDVNFCISLSRDAAGQYSLGAFGTNYPVTGWLRPTCETALEKPCKIKSPKSIYMGWYPRTNLCQDATQWFILGSENGQKAFSGYTTKSACPQACFAN
jgi:surface antigen